MPRSSQLLTLYRVPAISAPYYVGVGHGCYSVLGSCTWSCSVVDTRFQSQNHTQSAQSGHRRNTRGTQSQKKFTRHAPGVGASSTPLAHHPSKLISACFLFGVYDGTCSKVAPGTTQKLQRRVSASAFFTYPHTRHGDPFPHRLRRGCGGVCGSRRTHGGGVGQGQPGAEAAARRGSGWLSRHGPRVQGARLRNAGHGPEHRRRLRGNYVAERGG